MRKEREGDGTIRRVLEYGEVGGRQRQKNEERRYQIMERGVNREKRQRNKKKWKGSRNKIPKGVR